MSSKLHTECIHHVYMDHLHSYLKLGAFNESDVAHEYENILALGQMTGEENW